MSWIRKKRSVCFSVVTDGWRKSTVPCYCVESLRVTSLNLLLVSVVFLSIYQY